MSFSSQSNSPGHVLLHMAKHAKVVHVPYNTEYGLPKPIHTAVTKNKFTDVHTKVSSVYVGVLKSLIVVMVLMCQHNTTLKKMAIIIMNGL
jgi:diphthamide biosynthesis methyltransferase